MAFYSTAKTEKVLGHNFKWRLLEPLVYTYKNYIISAPKGFIHDFASVPRFLWSIFPPVGNKYDDGSIIHDYLYKTGKLPRKIADRIYLEAMKDRGVRKTRRYSIYAGVRCFGWWAWNNHRKND